MPRVDYEVVAGVYDAGRQYDREQRAAWRPALGPFVDRARPVLDIGSGTGQWSGLLADWFGVEVCAIEPSAAMRAQASARGRADVTVIGGSAEHLPLLDGSVGTAWLSAVWHHIDQPSRAAAELRRALVLGAFVCVRGAFPDAGAHHRAAYRADTSCGSCPMRSTTVGWRISWPPHRPRRSRAQS